MQLFSKIKDALKKTSSYLTSSIKKALFGKKVDLETLDELETLLLSSDLGFDITDKIISKIKQEKYNEEISFEYVKNIIETNLNHIFEGMELPKLNFVQDKLNVFVIIGVNGSGKTTFIGKFLKYIQNKAMSVGVAACDTFRYAAIHQLKVWAERTNASFFSFEDSKDPASVAYRATQEAVDMGLSSLVIDTAGRLQNHQNLMDELEKIIKVLKKLDVNITTLQVLDSTTGQNGLVQIETFQKYAKIDGLVVTKLDGSSKGGILPSITIKTKIPTYFICTGEQIDDMEEFDSKHYISQMLSMD